MLMLQNSIYLGIPKETTKVVNDNFQLVDQTSTRLKGGFFYGKNRGNNVYIPPRPLINHGIHRCMFLFPSPFFFLKIISLLVVLVFD